MVTLEQLDAMDYRSELHYAPDCKRTEGPRGGITEKVTRVRKNGAIQTWKTRPGEFRTPFKHGLKMGVQVTHHNAHQFHLASECPLGLR